MCWGSWTPHKVKLAVSGCPRNCAEATCKDVGVICVDSGYDIGAGFVFYFGRSAVSQSVNGACGMPYMPVANNSNFLVEQNYR